MSEPLYQLWRYNDWAMQLLLTDLIGQSEPVPPKCVELMSHLVNAQMIWASRMVSAKSPLGVWEQHDLLECERLHQLASPMLEKALLKYKEGAPLTINYTNTQQLSFNNSLLDILLHVFNHGTYHRAQIAAEMRRNGLVPVNTDYITFARQG